MHVVAHGTRRCQIVDGLARPRAVWFGVLKKVSSCGTLQTDRGPRLLRQAMFRHSVFICSCWERFGFGGHVTISRQIAEDRGAGRSGPGQ